MASAHLSRSSGRLFGNLVNILVIFAYTLENRYMYVYIAILIVNIAAMGFTLFKAKI